MTKFECLGHRCKQTTGNFGGHLGYRSSEKKPIYEHGPEFHKNNSYMKFGENLGINTKLECSDRWRLFFRPSCLYYVRQKISYLDENLMKTIHI